MADGLNIERLKDMPELKRLIFTDMWKVIDGRCKDGDDWRDYKSEFIYDGKPYVVSCQFKIRSIREKQHLTYRHFHIEHKQVVLNTEDVLQGIIHG